MNLKSFPDRLLSKTILKDAIEKGVASGDYFGYADGKDGDDYKTSLVTKTASTFRAGIWTG